MKTLYDLNKFEDWQFRQINRCRMYLQVITVRDLAPVSGTTINQSCMSRLPTKV